MARTQVPFWAYRLGLRRLFRGRREGVKVQGPGFRVSGFAVGDREVSLLSRCCTISGALQETARGCRAGAGVCGKAYGMLRSAFLQILNQKLS